jgi:hypothetical protein
MTNTSVGDPLSRYAAVNSLILQTYSQSCLDASYNKSIDALKQTSWDSSAAVGGRQWFWQTCVEFGFYQSTDSKNQPFGQTFPIESVLCFNLCFYLIFIQIIFSFFYSFFTKQCAEVFGPQFDSDFLAEAVANTNTYYGGYNYQGTRVVFVNGNIDPWHSLGFYEQSQPPNPYTEVIYIKGGAHCSDRYVI